MMDPTTKRWATILMWCAAGLWCAACESTPPALRQTSFEVVPSTTRAVVGDVVTLTAKSDDPLDPSANIQWRATGGYLTTEDRNRIARVRFDQPGTYTIGASVSLDGQTTWRDDATITVLPLESRR